MKPHQQIVTLVFLLFSCACLAQTPCDSIANYRQFDFWVGEWNVYQNGKKIAESSITPTQGNCGILEDYRPLNYAGGNSISYYDSADGSWKQNWVANGRVSHYVEPENYSEGEMQLIAKHTDKEGRPFQLRMIYYYDENADTVRQVMDRSTDEGETWTTVFDGLYQRKIE